MDNVCKADSDCPIGVFDSGLGGLTVAKELIRLMPDERIIYFGDTGRVPYGTRSRETISLYARQAESFLLKKQVKMIIAACGTVSSVAADTGDSLPVKFMGVVDSAAAEAATVTKSGRIGVLGTAATIGSGAFPRRIKQHLPEADVVSQECSLFVPLVENGWVNPDDEVTRMVVRRYLSPIKAAGVDCLILGCTHFPILAPFIAAEMGEGCRLIDTGVTTATAARNYLEENELLGNGTPVENEFYFTDKNSAFMSTTQLLMGDNISNVQFVALEALSV